VGALLVFDITQHDSFSNLQYWIDSLRESADENVQIGLFGMTLSLNGS
jgi:GTPase SAR1 family protein